MTYTDLCARLEASTGLNAWTREPVQDPLRLEAAAAIRELEAERDAVEALVNAAAQDAREVFEGYGSKAREAIDYMEQVALAAICGGAK